MKRMKGRIFITDIESLCTYIFYQATTSFKSLILFYRDHCLDAEARNQMDFEDSCKMETFTQQQFDE